ncbi:hypothetical protein L13192_06247, partial [Pyrenophora tritici-repentis]
KKGKALNLQQRQEYHGGSVFWSPRKLREARAREAVRERDETEEKLQKAWAKKQRKEAQLQRQVELEEKRVERQRLKEMREVERAEKAAERARKVEAQHQKKSIQQAQQRKRKASQVLSPSNKRQKRAGAAHAGVQAGDEPSAAPPRVTSHTTWRWLGQDTSMSLCSRWPPLLRKFIQNFLSERRVRVRLGNVTTPVHRVACGTPQGSPLSPVLYTLYLAELLNQDRKLRFGYADDINLYRVSHSLDENVALLAEDLKSINEWGAANKITFAPEKRELIHLTRQKGLHAPPIQLEDQTIHPIAPAQGGSQTALRWLGVWFDRGLTFKKHVAERAAQARKVA